MRFNSRACLFSKVLFLLPAHQVVRDTEVVRTIPVVHQSYDSAPSILCDTAVRRSLGEHDNHGFESGAV